MKKTVVILVLVIGAIIGTIYADRATRLAGKGHAATENSAKNQPEPDLTLKDLDGKDVSLAEFKGKVVLVNFWATWCDPCRDEIPTLIEMQQKYGPQGFAVLGIAMDDEGKSVVAPFVAKERFDVNGTKLPMEYPILIGNESAGEKFGGLLGYPTSVLISRDGKQVDRFTGILNHDELTKMVESQLKKS